MNSSTHQKIACVLIVLSAAVMAYSQTNPVKEATGIVTGKVTIKGKPAVGVVISLRPNNGTSSPRGTFYRATTDLQGDYRIANVPAGNYTVVPLAPALVDTNESRVLIVNKGETIEHIDIALVRGAVITGKVVDADGRPVIEQEVHVFVHPSTMWNYSGTQGLTDDRGIYRIYGLKAGSYKVAAGQGEDGRFGGHPVALYKRTYYPSVSDLDQATVIELSEGGEAKDIDIALGAALTTYTASGRIVDGETGQPLPNVEYGITRFIAQNSRSSTSNGAVSNSRGEFKLENLSPGRYAVFVTPGRDSNWRAEEMPFEVVDDDVTGLVVQAKKGASVSGVVVVEGADDKNIRNDLRQVVLTAAPTQPNETMSSAWSQIGADGSFSMSGLAAGTTMFHVGNASRFGIIRIERNGVPQSSRGIEIKEGENIGGLRIVLAYGNATLRGNVEIASGTLPPGSRLFVWLRNISENSMMESSSNTADADARGQFVIEGLLPGTYEINAGIAVGQMRVTFGVKKQEVVMTAGAVTNVTVSVDIYPNMPKP